MAPDIKFDSNPIKFESETLGAIELRHIKLGDLIFIEGTLEKVKDEKEFVYRLVHNQLNSPKLEFSNFATMAENEIKTIAREIVKHEKDIFKYYEEASDEEFFVHFRNAVRKHVEEERNKLKESLNPLGKTFDGFLKQYQPLISRSLIEDSFISSLAKNLLTISKQLSDSHIGIVGSISKQLSESYTGIAGSISKQLGESYAGLAESMTPLIKQIAASASALENLIKPQIGIWQKWADENKQLFEGIRSQWDSFQKRYEISESEAIRILKKYKWFISPSLPIELVFEVVKIGRKRGNKRREINGLFISYFCSNNYGQLETLFEGWKRNPIFKPRMKIFGDCIKGLKKASARCNPSNYVLPTLIAQIDGIQQEYMEKNGLTVSSRGKWKDSSGKEVDQKSWFKAQTANQDLLDVANDIFLNILFQKAQRGKPLETPFTFNRHKILHGEYVNYGRIDNTIRAFMVLDFLASLK